MFVVEEVASGSARSPSCTTDLLQMRLACAQAGGVTDILTPLQQAVQALAGCKGVPYIFLITDGAVSYVCPSTLPPTSGSMLTAMDVMMF